MAGKRKSEPPVVPVVDTDMPEVRVGACGCVLRADALPIGFRFVASTTRREASRWSRSGQREPDPRPGRQVEGQALGMMGVADSEPTSLLPRRSAIHVPLWPPETRSPQPV
jgi:hypothetical protein